MGRIRDAPADQALTASSAFHRLPSKGFPITVTPCGTGRHFGQCRHDDFAIAALQQALD